MTTRRIACIVEGHGEVEAAQVLVSRWLERRRFHPFFQVDPTVQRVPKGTLVAPYDQRRKLGIECYVTRAANAAAAAILVLIDSDGTCPMTLGGAMLARARNAVSHRPVAVVLPHREFEAWFLADLPHFQHRRELRPGALVPHSVPVESVQDCKGTFGRYLPDGCYGPVAQQAEFTGKLSFRRGMCRRSRSFRKLLSDLERITREARRNA